MAEWPARFDGQAVALVEQCIRLHGKGPATRLLDPFLGIGTSAIAAHRQQLENFTGIELDEHYLESARERLVDETTRLPEELPFGT